MAMTVNSLNAYVEHYDLKKTTINSITNHKNMKRLFTKLLGLVAMLAIGFSANATDYFISGAFNDWQHCNANYKMEGNNGVYTIQIANETFSGEFLIVSGTIGTPDWSDKWGGATFDANNIGKEVTAVKGADNFRCTVNVKNPTITFNPTAKTIKIEGQSSENDYDTVYIIGDINGEGWKEDITTFPMTLKAGTDNTWVGTLEVTAASWVKFKAGSFVYSADGSTDLVPDSGSPYTLSRVSGDKAVSLAPATYNITYVLDHNAETGTITFNFEGEGPTPAPEHVYLLGNIVYGGTDYQWNPVVTPEMTKTGNIFTLTDVTLENTADPEEANAYFSMATVIGDADWDAGVNTGDRFGAADEGTVITIGEAAPVTTYKAGVNASACMSWTVAKGTYDISFDFDAMTVTLQKTVGIADINAADEAPVYYYNLQGVRVDNPSVGTYIRVQGKKAEKVMMK